MITVYKYPFKIIDGVQNISIPAGAECLLVEMQDHQPCVWFKVYLDRPLEAVKLVVTGTGHTISSLWEHLGSFQQGIFVWHVWKDNT